MARLFSYSGRGYSSHGHSTGRSSGHSHSYSGTTRYSDGYSRSYHGTVNFHSDGSYNCTTHYSDGSTKSHGGTVQSSGKRAETAKLSLNEKGYTKVTNLGGIEDVKASLGR